MLNFFGRLIVNTLAVYVTDYLLSGVHIDTVFTAFVVSIVLAIANAIVKPLLVLITLPITILTFGIFIFVINALVVLLTSKLVPGFTVDSFLWAITFNIVLSLVNQVFNAISKS